MKVPLSILGTASQVQAAVMPSGALGLWYADQYSASPVPHIPNDLATQLINPSLLLGGRRLFSKVVLWSPLGCTVTDLAGLSHDGLTDATRLVGSGSWYLVCDPARQLTVAAGTYTVACWVKSNTGSSQTFRLTSIGNFHDSADLTATTSWQRFVFSTTYTAFGAERPGIRAASGGSTVDLLISDLEFFQGGVDITQPMDGHLKFWGAPTLTDGVDLSTGISGLIQFPAMQSLNGFTVVALLEPQADVSRFVSYFSNFAAGNSYLSLSAMYAQAGSLSAYIDGGNRSLWAGTNYDDQFNGAGYHLHGLRYAGTGNKAEVWIDDLIMSRTDPLTTSGIALGDAFVAGLANSLNWGNFKLAALAFYDRGLTDSEMRTAYAALKTRVSHTPASRIYIAEGDSITTTQAYCYPWKYLPNRVAGTFVSIAAISGSTLASMTARGSLVDAAIPPNRGSRKYILSVLIGANDIASYFGNSAAYITALASYCDARRAAGFLVAVCTILPSTQSNFNVTRNLVNTAIRTWVGTHCDAVIDFAADATMGGDSAASNTTYYSDGIHPTDAGHVILETVARTVLNAL